MLMARAPDSCAGARVLGQVQARAARTAGAAEQHQRTAAAFLARREARNLEAVHGTTVLRGASDGQATTHGSEVTRARLALAARNNCTTSSVHANRAAIAGYSEGT